MQFAVIIQKRILVVDLHASRLIQFRSLVPDEVKDIAFGRRIWRVISAGFIIMAKQIAQKTNESLGKLGKKNRGSVVRVDTNNELFYLGEFNNSHHPSFVNSGIIINDGAPESWSAFSTLTRTSLLGRECKLITHRDFHEKHIKLPRLIAARY